MSLALADEAKARGLDLLHLNIGDPNIYGFSPPAAVAEAAIRAIHDNLNGYAPSDGTTAALSAIREDAEARGPKPSSTLPSPAAVRRPLKLPSLRW